MSKNFCVTLLILLFIYSGCGKTTTEPGGPLRGVLTGQIIDSQTRAPVFGAIVSFFSGKNTAVTDPYGNFEIDSLPIGRDLMSVTKPGYESFTDEVSIITDRLTTYTGLLVPSFKGLITGWEKVQSGASATLTNACYATKAVIYICGFNGTLLCSPNGGDTWVNIATPTQENLYCVHFFDANTGIIMGNNGAIFRTTNGGKDWSANNNGGLYNFRNLSFSDTLNGTAVGGLNSRAVVFRTTDGGVSWTNENSSLDGFGAGALYGVSSPTATTGYVGGTDGKIYKTTDGGITWSQAFNGNAWIRSIFCTDANNGTLVGAAGMIRHTTDGGATWAIQNGSPAFFLNGISFSDPRHATAVGENGTIVHTRTSGAVWLDQSISGSGTFYGSAFADSVHGVIVGDNGAILRPLTK